MNMKELSKSKIHAVKICFSLINQAYYAV